MSRTFNTPHFAPKKYAERGKTRKRARLEEEFGGKPNSATRKHIRQELSQVRTTSVIHNFNVLLSDGSRPFVSMESRPGTSLDEAVERAERYAARQFPGLSVIDLDLA